MKSRNKVNNLNVRLMKLIVFSIICIGISSQLVAQFPDGYQAGGTSNGKVSIKNTNNKPLEFFTNNVFRLTIDSIGLIGSGTNLPKYALDLTTTSPGNMTLQGWGRGIHMPNSSALMFDKSGGTNYFFWAKNIEGIYTAITSNDNGTTNSNYITRIDELTGEYRFYKNVIIDSTLQVKVLPSGTAADSVVTASSTGVLRRRAASSISTEPWFNTATNTGATANTQNIYQSANVGIGIPSNAFRLNIGGTDSASNRKLGINGTQMLYLPNQTFGSGFPNSMFVGDGGQLIVSGGVPIGIGNTGVGIGALKALTTGFSNTALGSNSLSACNSGQGNTAIGSGVLSNLTNGSGNTGVGSGTNNNNSSGSNNTAIGASANQQNFTGSNNTAMGNSALSRNQAGSNGVAIGYFSQQNSNTTLTTWDNTNTSVGYFALYGSSSGVNTYLGNTAIGREVLYNITSGSNNTVLGYNSAKTITTGSNNTILGAQVSGLAAGMNNNIILADGIGNRRINVDSFGNTGISTIAPTNKLHVTAASNPLRIEGLQSGAASDSVLTTDVNGVVRMRSAISLSSSTEPWFNQATGSGATANTQNIYQMGNVGVGIAIPTEKLEVTGGNIKFPGQGYSLLTTFAAFGDMFSSADAYIGSIVKGNTVSSGVLKTGAALGSMITLQETDGIRFHVNLTGASGTPVARTTGEVMRITHTGNVGIGTTAPVDKLHVKSTTAGQQGIRFEDDSILFRLYRDIDVPAWANMRTDGGLGLAIIGTPDVPAITVSRHTGNVGVNTSTATSKLHVNGSFATAISAKTAAYTATNLDHILTASGTFAITLPTAVGIAGREYIIKNTGTGVITIATATGQSIDGAATIILSVQWSVRTVVSDGANWLIINNQ